MQSATAGITKKKPTNSKSNTHALHSYDQFNSFEAHAAMCPQNTTEETTMACFNTDDDPFIITCKEAIRNPAQHGDWILLVFSRERERLSQRWWVPFSQCSNKVGEVRRTAVSSEERISVPNKNNRLSAESFDPSLKEIRLECPLLRTV